MRRGLSHIASLALLFAFACSIAACRAPDASAPAAGATTVTATPLPAAYFTVVDEAGRTVSLTESEFAQLPRVSATVEERDQSEVVEGVPLPELLRLVGAPLGQGLRGGALALYVVVGAADGYQAVFALAELDPGMTGRTVLLASKKDGQPLADGEGPLRVVVPGEKRHARWVRQATRLTIRRAPR